MRSRFVVLAVVVALLLALAGCGADDTETGSAANPAATFVLTEWTVTLDGTVPAGEVTLKADNQGGEEHELVIVSAEDAASLPMASDGSVDEDKIQEVDTVGEISDIAPGGSGTATMTFKPGTYVAFCNIVDDMNMSGGMDMSGSNSTMTENGDGQMMSGSDGSMPMGHVHFAKGMYTTFTVK